MGSSSRRVFATILLRAKHLFLASIDDSDAHILDERVVLGGSMPVSLNSSEAIRTRISGSALKDGGAVSMVLP